ncbi:MAG TPA: hypothetical protein ENI02_00365 [Candidatus Aminicenantes bacterium]|nr:hypothetical protein [Candidatus Aminicenantes bacterium]
MALDKKPWYRSKTKWAGVLGGAGLALGGLVSWLNGESSFPIVDLYQALVVVLAVFGIRNIPAFNKK